MLIPSVHGRVRLSAISHSRTLLIGAVDEARTRDPQLGKLMLYQLSYYRIAVQMY